MQSGWALRSAAENYIEIYLLDQNEDRSRVERIARSYVPGRFCCLAISDDFCEWRFLRHSIDQSQGRERLQRYIIQKDKLKKEDPSHIPLSVQRLLRLRYDNLADFYALFERSDVSRSFYSEYKKKRTALANHISGIDSDEERRLYTQVVLDRLIFLYFLQAKKLLEEDERYLWKKFCSYEQSGQNFYADFLKILFFESINQPQEQRQPAHVEIVGKDIPYLNGGLFLPHRLESEEEGRPKITIDNEGFRKVLQYFESWEWSINEDQSEGADAIDPYILGYIFENSLGENKSAGVYYTPPQFSQFLTESTITTHLLDYAQALRAQSKPYERLDDFITNESEIALLSFYEKLRTLRICDPACGSGEFLVRAMYVLRSLHLKLIERADAAHFAKLRSHIAKDYALAVVSERPYRAARFIVQRCIYGLDLLEEAAEVAKLRLFLGMANEMQGDIPEPLPNIDFNIRAGNALTGFLDERSISNLLIEEKKKGQKQCLCDMQNMSPLLKKHGSLIFAYENEKDTQTALSLRRKIDELEQKITGLLGPYLEQAMCMRSIAAKDKVDFIDFAKDLEAKKELRAFRLNTERDLKALHWAYLFPALQGGGGFDIVLLNPPWEAWKPNSQEFFEQRIQDFRKLDKNEAKKAVARLFKKDSKLKSSWLQYNCRISAMSDYFRKMPFYPLRGKGDINLYKLFLERSYYLLGDKGSLGIVIPSGFYTDAGCADLRREFLEKTRLHFLYGFENKEGIFENVHRSYKFVLLSLSCGAKTQGFGAAFMLRSFEALQEAAQKQGPYVQLKPQLIQKLNPQSLSIMEYKSERDVRLSEKLSAFPRLEEEAPQSWSVRFANEFHMTNHAYLFEKEGPLKKKARWDEKTLSWQGPDGSRHLPLYEGKMLWQYDSYYEKPRYWINVKKAQPLLQRKGAAKDEGAARLPYEDYRLAFRNIIGYERTWIMALLPPQVFTGNSISHFYVTAPAAKGAVLSRNGAALLLCAFCNSFVIDCFIRQKIAMNLSSAFVLSCPLPRWRSAAAHPYCQPLIERAASLVSTSAAYDRLLQEFFGKKATHKTHGLLTEAKRQRAKNEIDAMVAKVYQLSADELRHVLASFAPQDKKKRERMEAIKEGVMQCYAKLKGG